MHTEYNKGEDGLLGPVVVADPGDFTCECHVIIPAKYIDDNVFECGICGKNFCGRCIVTKDTADVRVCYECQDDMVHERLNRES